MPKSTRPRRPSSSTMMLAGCGSPWKTPWRKIISSHASAIRIASRRRSSIGVASQVEVAELDAHEPLERQHPLAGVRAVHARDGDPRLLGEVAPEDLGVAGLDAVVELAPDRAGELVHHRHRVDERRAGRRAGARSARPGRAALRSDSIWRAAVGRCTLTATRRPFGELGEVHLADRRRRDRHRVEGDEQAVDGRLELGLDTRSISAYGHRRDRVLEQAQLGEDLGRDDVGAGREQLPELDERRPELVEHLAQVAAERGQVLRLDHRRAPQRVPLEHEPEPVLGRDLGDLAHAAHGPAPVRERGHGRMLEHVLAPGPPRSRGHPTVASAPRARRRGRGATRSRGRRIAPGELERLVALAQLAAEDAAHVHEADLAVRRRGQRRRPPADHAQPHHLDGRPVSSATSRTTPRLGRLVRSRATAGQAPAAVVGPAVEQHPAAASGSPPSPRPSAWACPGRPRSARSLSRPPGRWRSV